MDDSQKQTIRDSVLEHFGVDKYNRLISAVEETIDRGTFRYWQDDLFAKLQDKTKFTVSTVEEYANIFRGAAGATKEITLEQFLTDPNRYYYMEPVVILDEWIVQAWEQSDAFRENVTYEYAREASKNGDLECLEDSLRQLTSILPMHRNIELYCSIRDMSPHRECEFRPTFERIFGNRIAEFPDPVTDEQLIDMFGEDMAREMGITRPAE